MKNLKYLLVLICLFLVNQMSIAQIKKIQTPFEISTGLHRTKGNLRWNSAAGFWVTPHLLTRLFYLSPQRKTILFEPSSLRLPDGRFEKASIKLGATSGLDFRVYHHPKLSIFGGAGITRQQYLITAKSVFENDFNPGFGAPLASAILNLVLGNDLVRKETTSTNVWGFRWQVGYAIPTKNGRWEIVLSQNNFLIKNKKYAYPVSSSSSEVKYRSVQSDFDLAPVAIKVNFVFDLF